MGTSESCGCGANNANANLDTEETLLFANLGEREKTVLLNKLKRQIRSSLRRGLNYKSAKKLSSTFELLNFTPEDQTNSEIKLVLSEVRNGKLILNFNAASGIKYKLERSENLIEWKLYRELKPEQAEATIEVPMATDGFGQFYRLKSE